MNQEKTVRAFTLSQVAQMLGMSRRAIENFVRDGELACVRFGRSIRIRDEDLRAFACSGTKRGQAARRLEAGKGNE